jgi:hypothetical protein
MTSFKTLRKFLNEVDQLNFECFAKSIQLHQIQTPLTSFAFTDERLRFLEARSQIILRDVRTFSEFPKHRSQ